MLFLKMGMYGIETVLLLIFVGPLRYSHAAAPTWTNPANADTLTVAESETSGFLVTTLVATGGEGALIYSLGATANQFEVPIGTANLVTKAALDYETTSSYTLTLSVSDSVNPAVEITVTIDVTDVNDNAPVLTITPASLELLSGTDGVLATITHTDDDVTTEFTNATYTITAGDTNNRFQINAQNKIETTAALTYDSNESPYTLTITATDADQNTDTATFVLTVYTKPVFSTPTAVGVQNLAESATGGTVVFTFTAADADGTPTAVNYSIEQPGAQFEVVGDAVQVATGITFDYESQDPNTFDVVISATDGTHVTNAPTQTITITDVDEPPIFSSSTVALTVPENYPVGHTLYTAVATDPEAATVTYSITAGNTNTDFTIDSSTGALAYAKTLDKATTASYSLTIQASDGAVTATITLPVNVNAAPVFNLGAVSPIEENLASATSVFRVVATDAEGDTITYDLTSDTVAGAFTLTAQDVFTGLVFDFESGTTSYDVTLSINDGVNNAVTQTITFAITDLNDVAPVVTADPVSTILLEQSAADTLVSTISSTDDDVTPSFQSAIYTITNGNALDRFKIVGDQLLTKDALIEYTEAASYTLEITATDGGGNNGTVTVNVTIESAPEFTDPTVAQAVSLDESAVGGTTVFTVAAVDNDQLPNPLTFTILSQPAAHFDMSGADVVVASGITFDFETAAETFDVVVRASDGKHTTDTLVQTVTIADVNETPTFTTASPPTLQVPETWTLGTSIYAAVATDPENSALTYSITAGDTNADFAVSSTGEVTIAKALSRTTTATYSLTIEASDGNSAATITLPIAVNAGPIFSSPAASGGTVSIPENTQSGSSVYTLEATDPDGNIVVYSIVTATPPISLDGATVNTATTFDFEGTTGTTYEVVIQATDDSSFTLTSTVSLTLEITNSNEAPVCNPATYSATVVEQSGAINSISQILATDVDAGDTLTYAITTGDPVFAVSSSGLVSTQGSLNYITGPSHALTITVTDVAGLTDTATLNVAVDSIPTFTAPPVKSVPEKTAAGASLYQLSATDADDDTITYEFTNAAWSPAFTMQSSGIITLASALDFESGITEYILEFKASDPQSNTATASLTISVTDSNDLAPMFAAASYSGAVKEHVTPAVSVLTVAATDGDTSLDDNNVIRFSITAGNSAGLFTLDATTGLLEVTNLDYATAATHVLTITAMDKAGSGGLSSTVEATVTVLTGPVFTEPANPGVSITVPENTATSTSVFQLTATDADGLGTVAYTVTSVPATFVLDGTIVGQINTGTAQLDLDVANAVPRYTITITATDGTYTSETTLVINIGYANDNIPVFSGTYTSTIQETLAIGGSVASVTATDADVTADHNTVTYSITAGNGDGKFSMATSSPSTEVLVAAALDYTTASSYSLTIQASDGDNQATTTLTVTVKTAPAFTAPVSGATATVSEDSVVTSSIFTLVAADEDGDAISYEILSQPNAGQFQLSGAEVQLALATLDYETVTGPFNLTFKAKTADGLVATSNVLTISVTDVNDNPPLFSADTYTKTMKAGATSGTSVYQLAATDGDASTANNQISTYAIVGGNTDSDFAISSIGLITVANTLVISKPNYTLQVRATDSGTPPQTGDTSVEVTVAQPSNAVITAPATGSTSAVSIAEDLAVSNTVFTVVATDPDGDTLVYSIKTQTPDDHFTLTGNILSVATALDYESTTSYTIVFNVDDNDGEPSNKQTSGVLTITITDINDFPMFAKARYDTKVMEHITEVKHVIQVQASNQETSQTLVYSIVSGDPDGDFTVDNTGQVATTSAGLTRHKQLSYLLAIQAVDDGSPPRADSTHIFVEVTPYNAAERLVSSLLLLFSISALYVML